MKWAMKMGQLQYPIHLHAKKQDFDGTFGKNDWPKKPLYPPYSKINTRFEELLYGAQPEMKSELLYHS